MESGTHNGAGIGKGEGGEGAGVYGPKQMLYYFNGGTILMVQKRYRWRNNVAIGRERPSNMADVGDASEDNHVTRDRESKARRVANPRGN